MQIPPELRSLIRSGCHAHIVTLNTDGSPQVTLVWIGIENDEIVAAHLPRNKKVRNIEHDPRVAISLEASTKSNFGLTEYAVIYGTRAHHGRRRARTAPETGLCVHRSGSKFPPMDNPPPGYITRIRVDRIEGVGPWTGRPV